MHATAVDMIGYGASVFLIISFILKKQFYLRLVNLIGCLCFVAYGFLIGNAWPVIIPNAIIAITQVYHLWINPIKEVDLHPNHKATHSSTNSDN